MPQAFAKNSHCSYCGARFPEGLAWPRHCPVCGNVSYVNPLPVAVVLLPVDGGLLLVRRSIEPQRGALSLPGGFMEVGETWQEAGARELHEETGIALEAGMLTLYDARSAPDGFLLVFGLAPARHAADLPPFTPTDETSETVIAREPTPLAFSTHTEVASRWWRER
jgi:ADP-ribose pyrophosphatase YjhB (NUDIX family)